MLIRGEILILRFDASVADLDFKVGEDWSLRTVERSLWCLAVLKISCLEHVYFKFLVHCFHLIAKLGWSKAIIIFILWWIEWYDSWIVVLQEPELDKATACSKWIWPLWSSCEQLKITSYQSWCLSFKILAKSCAILFRWDDKASFRWLDRNV